MEKIYVVTKNQNDLMAHNHSLIAHSYTISRMFNFSVNHTTIQQTQFTVHEVAMQMVF